MSFNTFGKIFRFTTWGESHGPAIGCIVDGCPPNINIKEQDIQIELDKRKPGQSKFTTQRKEDDKVQILSGVFEGKTTGTPISLIIYNKEQKQIILPTDFNFKDKKKNALSFLNKQGNPYKQIFIDYDGSLSINLGAYGIPETLLINNKKIVLLKFIGPLNSQKYSVQPFQFREAQLVFRLLYFHFLIPKSLRNHSPQTL